MSATNQALIFGATGNVGGATARQLLAGGWKVRAVTRNLDGKKARALSALGAEVVRADMDDRPSLEAAFEGMTHALSVQNWMISGAGGEVRQGKLVADVARAAGIEHLVYASAGTGEKGTGLDHFDSKVEVEAFMRELDLPVTVIRPGPFMELMTQRDFFPALGIWGVAPRVVGWHTPKPWVAVRDIGKAAANAFADPDTWVRREVNLIGDVRSLAECRAEFQKAHGKTPFRVPLPTGLFSKMAGEELVEMWRWIAEWAGEAGPDPFWEMVAASRELVPDIEDVPAWLQRQVHGNERGTRGQRAL
jgi:uncharacterized protein YbjT (DUF2867 family)